LAEHRQSPVSDHGSGSGVESGRILFFSDPEPESNICEKLDPDPDSLLFWAVAGVCVVFINVIA